MLMTEEVRHINVAVADRRRFATSAMALWLRVVMLALGSLSGTLPAFAQAPAATVELETRPNVKVRMLVIRPTNPVAAVILLAGGDGVIDLSANGAIRRDGNFLVRSRGLFAERGLAVAVMDAPSDQIGERGLLGFRQTPEHVRDLGAAVAYMRKEFNLPVWLVGTSRGTTSAAMGAIGLGDKGPFGIVLTSSMLSSGGGELPTLALDQIRVPTLVVHHEQDECQHCKFADVPKLMNGLKNAPSKELITFKGGMRQKGKQWQPCEAFSYHGYYGIETGVVDAVSKWVSAKSKS